MSLLVSYVTYRRDFVRLGGVNVAVYLTAILCLPAIEGTDWKESSISAVEKSTGLTPNEQMMARIQLRGMKVLIDKPVNGDPVIRIDEDKLRELLSGGNS